jgi:hypothetical protein
VSKKKKIKAIMQKEKKKNHHKIRTGGMAQGVVSEFNSSTTKTKDEV